MLIHFDTERSEDGSPRDSRRLALAYAHLLGRHFDEVRVVDLPEAYMEPLYHRERRIFKADLDSALAAGLTEEEWAACVERGVSFFDATDAPALKLVALVHAYGENVIAKDADVGKILEGQLPTAVADGLTAFCKSIRSLAYDTVEREYDATRLDALVQPVHKLFKWGFAVPVERVRALVLGRTGGDSAGGPPSLTQRGIFLRSGAAYRKAGQRPYELISNVVPISICSGHARFLIGPARQRHIVALQGRDKEIEVYGSIYDPANWTWNDDYRVCVARPADFKSLLQHGISVNGIQSFDPSATRMLWVGTYLDGNGKLAWQDGVDFPAGEEECPYSGRRFFEDGDKDILKRIADLHTDGATAVWEVADLGSVFKPALHDAYPHICIIGRSGSGKSTIGDRMIAKLGRRRYSARTQWNTPYRIKKTLANTNLPVMFDEIQRLSKNWYSAVIEALNASYNIQLATHGNAEKTYVLGAPAVLLGQDLPFEDIALNTKIVRITLETKHQDPAALNALDHTDAVAPYREWVAFAADYANRVDVDSLVEQQVEYLRRSLQNCNYTETSNTGRLFWNYATLLFTADALAAFGVQLDIQAGVTALLRDHLTLGAHGLTGQDRSSIGNQFLNDVVAELQTTTTRFAFPWIVKQGNLYFHVAKTLEHLQRHGHNYDVITPDAMAGQLKTVGVTFDDHRPTINGVQTRCARVPASVLEGLGVNVQGLGVDDEAGGASGSDL